VGIEAMAYQKPVVAFDVGGISEWLKDRKTGYLVQSGDIRDLAEKIDLILRNPTLAEAMGHQARIVAENIFAEHYHYESLLTLFQKAIDNHCWPKCSQTACR
jgi:glycosyltransferase involved in cell wall biosynthesis